MPEDIKKGLLAKGVVHVGAHRGEEFNDHVAMGAKQIVWVEANPDLFDELVSNLTLVSEGSSVENHIFNIACSNVDDENMEFHVIYGPDAGYGVGNKGCSSLLRPSGNMENWKRGTITVNTVTLDSLFERNNLNFEDFDMLELDVQGAELMVLEGASKLLDHIKYIYTEVTFFSPDYENNPLFDDVSNFLADRGFSHVATKFYDGVSHWADALFERIS